jgi:hypothetical protein
MSLAVALNARKLTMNCGKGSVDDEGTTNPYQSARHVFTTVPTQALSETRNLAWCWPFFVLPCTRLTRPPPTTTTTTTTPIYAAIYAPEGLGKPPCPRVGARITQFGFPLSPTTSHTSAPLTSVHSQAWTTAKQAWPQNRSPLLNRGPQNQTAKAASSLTSTSCCCTYKPVRSIPHGGAGLARAGQGISR